MVILNNLEKQSTSDINIVDLPPEVQELVLDHLKQQVMKKSNNYGKIKLN